MMHPVQGPARFHAASLKSSPLHACRLAYSEDLRHDADLFYRRSAPESRTRSDRAPGQTMQVHARETIREVVAQGLGMSLMFDKELPPDIPYPCSFFGYDLFAHPGEGISSRADRT